MSGLRILASGVDTLYMSARGALYEGLLVCLQGMRDLNPKMEEIPFSFHTEAPNTVLRQYGRRGYKFLLSSLAFDISLGAGEQFPEALIELRSQYIHSVGLETAVDQITELMSRDFFPHGFKLKVSRVDVFADEQGWQPKRGDFSRFVCRAVKASAFDQTPTRVDEVRGQFSGFTFGKGDVVARIYDKTVEMGTDTWPELMWVGRDEDEHVWRIEFQYRRKALKELRVFHPEDVLHHRQGLWQYGLKWLSLRERTKDQTRSRWHVAGVWTELGSAAIGGSAVPLIRERIHEVDVARLTQGLVGFATSLEALGEAQGLSKVVAHQVPAVSKYLAHRGTGMGEIVEAKKRRVLDENPLLVRR